MESSRQDLSNDMGEHWPILKNNYNLYYPRIGFTPKTDVAFPKTGLFLLCSVTDICYYVKVIFLRVFKKMYTHN